MERTAVTSYVSDIIKRFIGEQEIEENKIEIKRQRYNLKDESSVHAWLVAGHVFYRN